MPWLGDLPYLGALFRYRTQVKSKTELMVILTPHVVRNRMEADRMLAEESARMDWMLDDVTRYQGLSGMEPVLHPKEFIPPIPSGDGCLPSPLTEPDGPLVVRRRRPRRRCRSRGSYRRNRSRRPCPAPRRRRPPGRWCSRPRP